MIKIGDRHVLFDKNFKILVTNFSRNLNKFGFFKFINNLSFYTIIDHFFINSKVIQMTLLYFATSS